MGKYKTIFREEDGVWRTISGRRVFIRKGQSLSEAMKESGKFKTKKKDEEENKEKDTSKETYKSKRSFESYYEKMKGHGDRDSWTGKEYTNDEFMEHLTDSNWHQERKMLEEANLTNEELGYIKDKTSLSKWGVGEELTGRENTQKLINEAKENFASNINKGGYEEYLNYKSKKNGLTDRDARDLLKQLNDEGSDFMFDDKYAELKDGKLKTNVGVFMPWEDGYTNRELEIPISADETYDTLEEKMRDWQSRHDNPDSFYDKDFDDDFKELKREVYQERGIMDYDSIKQKMSDIKSNAEQSKDYKELYDLLEEEKYKRDYDAKLSKNIIPRDFEKGYGRYKVETSAGKNLNDLYEVTKDEFGEYHAKNLRTGEDYATFREQLNNKDVFQFEREKNYKINPEVVKEQYLNPDNLIKDNLVRKDEKVGKGNNFYVASISPDDYLDVTTTPELYDKIIKDNKKTGFELDTNKLDKSYMYLTVDPETGKVVGHNGRHRMLELKKAGYKKADILIFDASNNSRNLTESYDNNLRNLKGQFGYGGAYISSENIRKVDDDYFGGDLRQSKPFKTNEANPLKEYAEDGARQRANAEANRRAMQKTNYENFEIGQGKNKISGIYNEKTDEVIYTKGYGAGRKEVREKLSNINDASFPSTDNEIVKNYIQKQKANERTMKKEKEAADIWEENRELYKKYNGFADTGDAKKNKEVEAAHNKWLENKALANKKTMQTGRVKDIEKKLEDIEWQGERGSRLDGHLRQNENYGTLKEEYKKLTGKDYKAPFKQGVYKDKKTGNDYLPKTSKILTAGNSNRKEVSDNIQAHILSHYDNPVDFMEQMNAFDNMPSKWHAGQEMAKQGFYDIYYDDQRDFLNSLNINPKNKEFTDDRVFQTYTSLVGRESERLYNKLDKLYEQYKKEHKNSNVSLSDFRKWFK